MVKNKAAALYGNKAAIPFPNIYDYQEEDWLYSEIILESEGKKEAIKFRCITSGPELVKYDRKKVATVYYFKRSRIIEKIVFDEGK